MNPLIIVNGVASLASIIGSVVKGVVDGKINDDKMKKMIAEEVEKQLKERK